MERTDHFYLERSAKIIETMLYGVLSTVTPEGGPYISPVRIIHDDELSFYWFSDKNAHHSVNLQARGEAALVLFDSAVPEGQGAGVYVLGNVTELEDPAEIERVQRLKYPDREPQPGSFVGEAVRRVYRLVPREVWTNGAEMHGSQFVRDVRIDLNFASLKPLIKS